jgi:hypothetical protein
MAHLSRRYSALALSLAAAMVASFTFVSAAGGDFSPDFSAPYTQGADGDCRHHAIDPINVEFKGAAAGVQNTADSLVLHLFYRTYNNGSKQNLRVHVNGSNYDCHGQDDQRASNCGTCTRYHIRLWWIPAPDSTKKTVGDAHYETNSCGGGFAHAVDDNSPPPSGFDWGRRLIRHAFAHAGHYAKTVEWGNTRNFAQCNASHPDANHCPTGPATSDYCQGWAGSDGNGAIIDIGHQAYTSGGGYECTPTSPSCRFYYWNYGFPGG